VPVWQRKSREKRQGADSPRYLAVVDAGSTMLRLLVVEAAGGRATVWGWAEVPSPGSSVSTGWLIDACGKALSRAEEMAQDLAERWLLPDRMVVGLPGSHLVGRAWPVVQRRSRPDRPVEERELRALLERALRLAVNRLLSTAPDEGEWLLVDSTPVTLAIDGRGVTDPVGFRASEMGATVFAALAEASTLTAWRAVAAEMNFRELLLVGTPTALAATISWSQGMLLDIGGEATDLVWCRGGRPVAIDSLPSGGSALTRSLVRRWNLAPDRAERLKRAYAAGRLKEEAQDEVREVLLPTIQAWLTQVEETLAHLNLDAALPARLYLLGGGSATAEIGESVGALAWSRRLTFERHPEVYHLRPTDVPGVLNRTDRGQDAGDVAALALAAWAARQQQPPERPASILSQLCSGR
jgi:cell division ATPase FtsA